MNYEFVSSHPSTIRPRDKGSIVDSIVVHTTGGDKDSSAINTFKYGNPGGNPVSAHYVIKKDGSIVQMVKLNDKAAHAGESVHVDGKRWLNSRSVGIEVVGTDRSSITSSQMASLVFIVSGLLFRFSYSHNKPLYVLGHRVVSPGRKTDPAGRWDDFMKDHNDVKKILSNNSVSEPMINRVMEVLKITTIKI